MRDPVMRVTGPDGLNEVFDLERDAVLRALDWAGYPIEDADCATTALDTLYDHLERTLQRTGEFIWVREA